jgi:diketogulonate reductase-like aldo/keto reductase
VLGRKNWFDRELLLMSERFYGNEKEVGDGLRASGVPREEVFVRMTLFTPLHSTEMTLVGHQQGLGHAP